MSYTRSYVYTCAPCCVLYRMLCSSVSPSQKGGGLLSAVALTHSSPHALNYSTCSALVREAREGGREGRVAAIAATASCSAARTVMPLPRCNGLLLCGRQDRRAAPSPQRPPALRPPGPACRSLAATASCTAAARTGMPLPCCNGLHSAAVQKNKSML